MKNKSDQFIQSISASKKEILMKGHDDIFNNDKDKQNETLKKEEVNLKAQEQNNMEVETKAPKTTVQKKSKTTAPKNDASKSDAPKSDVEKKTKTKTQTPKSDAEKKPKTTSQKSESDASKVNEPKVSEAKASEPKVEPVKVAEVTSKTDEQTTKPYPVIGLALGGGGSLGLAHIGVIRVLDQNGIKISKIAGTSMGSIVGAFYCNGFKFKSMHKIANKLRGYHMLDFNLSGKGFLNGKGVERIIRKYIPVNKKIEDFKREFACNAIDLYTGKEVVFTKGNVIKAIRASFSVPGIFAPTKIDDMLLVDGGLINNVPDNIVKNMGADIIISVNVINTVKQNPEFKTLRDVMYQSAIITQVNLRKEQNNCSDVMIEPKVENYKQYIFNKKLADDVIKLGEKAAKEALPKILQSIIDFQNKQ